MAAQAVVEEGAGHARVGVGLGQAVAHGLLVRQRRAEGLALLEVVSRPDHGRFHGGHGGNGHQQPLLRQLLHQLHEAAAFLAQQGVGTHAQVFEEELGGVLRVQAHLLQPPPAAEAGQVGVHQQQAHALGAAGGVGLGGQHQQVAQLAVGDEDLLAVDAVAGALWRIRSVLALGPRAHARHVAAGAGLGHADGANDLAAHHARQPALLLRLGAVLHEVGRDDVGVQVEDGPGGAGARQFFHHDGAVAEVHARAAIFLGHGQAQQAELARALPNLPRHLAVTLPLGVEGRDPLLHKAPHGDAELVVFGGVQGGGGGVEGIEGGHDGVKGAGTLLRRKGWQGYCAERSQGGGRATPGRGT